MLHRKHMATEATDTGQAKTCVAIINPAGAGGRAKRLWSQAAPLARKRLGQHGYQLVEQFTAAPGDGQQLAAAAVSSGAAVVMAVGGDGTLHEVVTGMMSNVSQQQQQQQQHVCCSSVLAVAPLGTGCDFARHFSWSPNDVLAACDRITCTGQQQQQQQTLDVGRVMLKRRRGCRCCCPGNNNNNSSSSDEQSKQQTVDAVGDTHLLHDQQQQQQQQQLQSMQAAAVAGDGQLLQQEEYAETKTCYFVNVMSCGIAGDTNQLIDSGGLKVLGGAAYKIAAAIALMRYQPRSVQLKITTSSSSSSDGSSSSSSWQTLDDLTALVIGNCSYWGAGFRVLPAADSSDGLMDGVVLQRLGFWDFITKGHLLKSGKYQGISGVTGLPQMTALNIRSISATTAAAAAAAAAVECKGTAATNQQQQCLCLLWEVDGEFMGSWCEATVEVLPATLRVCA